MNSILPKSRKNVNWFFWVILILITCYYAYYFFISFSARERYLYRSGRNDLESMVNSIKARETFYLNMAYSWKAEETCEFFQDTLGFDFLVCGHKDSMKTELGESLFKFGNQTFVRFKYGSESSIKSAFIETDELFSRLLHDNSIFDEYFIIVNKSGKVDVLYSNTPFSLVSDMIKVADSARTASVYSADILVSGVEKKSFTTTFKLRGDEYAIIGLADSEHWLDEKKHFNFVGSLISAGLIAVVILFIPHLRLINLSFYDRLGNANIIKVFSSFILIFPIVTIVVFSISTNHQLNNYLRQELDKYSSEIDKIIKSTTRELTGFVTGSPVFQEFFFLDSEGKIKELWHFNNQEAGVTIGNNLRGNNLSYRDYFKSTQKDPTSAYLEIVKSVTSNENFEINLAVKHSGVSYVDVRNNTPVDKINKLINSPKYEGFFYQIVNKNGNLLFDSRRGNSRNVSGNVFNRFEGGGPFRGEFLNKMTHSEDSSSLRTKSVLTTYENQEVISKMTRISFEEIMYSSKRVKPVEDYFLVASVGEGKKLEFLRANLMLTCFVILLYIILIYAVWGGFWLITKRRSYLLRKQFSLPWLMRDDKNSNAYLGLGVISVIWNLVLIGTILSFRLDIISSLFIISLSTLSFILIAYLIIQKDRFGWVRKLAVVKNQDNDSKSKRYGYFLCHWFATLIFVPVILLVYLVKFNSLRLWGQGSRFPSEVYFSLRGLVKEFDIYTILESVDYVPEVFDGFKNFMIGDLYILILLPTLFILIFYMAQKFIFGRVLLLKEYTMEKSDAQIKSKEDYFALDQLIDHELSFIKQYEEIKYKAVKKQIKNTFKVSFKDLYNDSKENLSLEAKELIIFIIQDKFESTFDEKWRSLSAEERFLLFDLAEDGCMNSKNIYLVHKLREQGFLEFVSNSGNALRLKSHSFQNYILMESDNDDELIKQLELSKKGTWGVNNTVVIMAILSLFLISFTIHEHVIEKVLAIATGLFAFLPSIIGYLGKLNFKLFSSQ